MKVYELNTELTFGHFTGHTVFQILEKGSKSYIGWCILNLDHFLMDSSTLREIEEKFPEPKFDQDVYSKNHIKNIAHINQRRQNAEAYHNRVQQRSEMNSYFDDYNDDLDPDQQSPDFWNQF